MSKVQYDRGVKAAKELIARGDGLEIRKMYHTSQACLDPNDFDRGYQEVIWNYYHDKRAV